MRTIKLKNKCIAKYAIINIRRLKSKIIEKKNLTLEKLINDQQHVSLEAKEFAKMLLLNKFRYTAAQKIIVQIERNL